MHLADPLVSLLQSLGLSSALKPFVDTTSSVVNGVTESLGLGDILVAKGANQSPVVSLSADAKASCIVHPYDAPAVLPQSFPAFDPAKANIFRYRQQQAVNLGSWFVHEQWMTPSLFVCAADPKSAEIDIASGWGNTTGARIVLERHWDTFITEDDFKYLASIGINTVRLPIGYWSLGPSYLKGTPFEPVADVYKNSWNRVLRAINWAGESGIGVLIDLHGAPGSQNGQAHSGISDGQTNFFRNVVNQDATIVILTFLTRQLANVTNVIGIQILNEPNDDPGLSEFYNRAISAMRQASTEGATLPIYIHDAFNLEKYENFTSSRADFIVEDHHSYFVFNPKDRSQNADQETAQVYGSISHQLSSASQAERRNLVIGEWSCALNEQALEGQSDPLHARQQFCRGQQQVYANVSAGWHFWSYTKEGCDGDLDWCFKNAVGNTLPSGFFAYNYTPATSADKSVTLAHTLAEIKVPTFAEAQTPIAIAKSKTGADAPLVLEMTHSRRSDARRRHRFVSVHRRQAFLSDISRHKKDGISSPLAGLTATDPFQTKGYSDGYLTAKTFAQSGLSRLGFKGQYISDSIKALGSEVIPADSENSYTSSFLQGLADGEKAAAAIVQNA